VLDEARVVVLGVVAAGFVAVVGGDVAVATGGSGCRRGGWGACWGGRKTSHETVIDVVDNVDGGCAAVVIDDVVTSRAVLGCSAQVCEAVSQVLGRSVDVPASFSRHSSTSVAVCIAVSTESVVVVWDAVSVVIGVTWVAASVVVTRVRVVDNSREAQRPSPWFNTQFSFSSWWPSSFPCSSTSSILSSTSTPHCQ
jgi:hypothetical protein